MLARKERAGQRMNRSGYCLLGLDTGANNVQIIATEYRVLSRRTEYSITVNDDKGVTV